MARADSGTLSPNNDQDQLESKKQAIRQIYKQYSNVRKREHSIHGSVDGKSILVK